MDLPQRAPPPPHPGLALAEALARRAALADELWPALTRRELSRVRQLSDAVTATASEISEWSLRFQAAPGGPERREMEELLGRLVARADAADQRVRAALVGDGWQSLADWMAACGASPSTLAEELLAEPWDRERDLLVLVGGAEPAVAQALVEEGQRRVMWLSDGGAAPEGVVGHRELEGLDAACWHLGWPYPDHFRLRQLGPCRVPFEAVTKRLTETLGIIQSFTRGVQDLGPKLLKRCTANAPLLAKHPSAARLVKVLEGVPAIIVSAGPSLDKNLHLLHALKGRALIIAINQTVKALRRAGVQPDVVMACDHQNLSYHFEGVVPGEIPFLGLGASVNPALFELPAGAIFTFASSPIVENWLFELCGESAALRAGGTVSVSALHLAVGMGCSPIVFIGQDLALAGTKYYAEGAADGTTQLIQNSDGTVSVTGESKVRLADPGDEEKYLRSIREARFGLVEVPGYYGGTVETTASMRAQIVAMRAHLRDLKGKAEFVNATEGGAFLEGMEHRSLQWLVDRFAQKPHDLHGRIARSLEIPSPSERRLRMRTGLQAIHRDLALAAKLARRLGRAKSASRDARCLQRLQRAAGRVSFLPLISMAEIESAELAARERESLEALDRVEQGLFLSIQNAGEQMLPVLAEALAGFR